MPRREHNYYVYILASRSRTLYIGVSSNLAVRLTQHRLQTPGTHTARYNIHRLVYVEHHRYILNATAREKELKHYTRTQKIALIEAANPTWQDLAQDLLEP